MHTWSLAVEMQFYAFVPLLFLFLNKAETTKAVILISSVFASSLALHVYLSSTATFFLMPCRLWQFMAGIMAYYMANWSSPTFKETQETSSLLQCGDPVSASTEICTETRRTENRRTDVVSCWPPAAVKQRFQVSRSVIHSLTSYINLTLLMLLLLLATQYCDFVMNANATRITVTFLTAVQIYLGSKGELRCLSQPAASWIGDVSYVSYLVHWPIILFYKYWSTEQIIGTRG